MFVPPRSVPMTARSARFEGVVKKAGINPYVDVPAGRAPDVIRDGRRAVLVRVQAKGNAKRSPGTKTARDRGRLIRIGRLTSNGWFRTHVVPMRGGPHRLFLDSWMRDGAGVGVGDTVSIRIKPDPAPRSLPIPTALRAALKNDAKARKAWDTLPPSGRKEALSYLLFLKSPEAIDRTVRKVIAQLRR